MKNRIYLNNGWQFSTEFDEKMLKSTYKKPMETVRIPHSVCKMPFNNFDESIYQMVSAYRKVFVTDTEWKEKTVLLTVGAAAHFAEVFLNGKKLCEHKCGYTSFTVDLTENLAGSGKNNVLVIKVDSRETLNVPPFGNAVDYMTYGGIYRDVYLEIKNPVYIKDISIATEKNHFTSNIELNADEIPEGFSITQKITAWNSNAESCAEPSAEIICGVKGKFILTSADAAPVIQWSLENPQLYILETKLFDAEQNEIDSSKIRFGFRDIRFDETGFYLNGNKIKLRGLNRHQSYPYVGYAMPESLQKEDADILKYELGLNEVRTSHYPQSHHFIDRCDEIGLLVFTELPGWQYIGNEEWKDVAVNNVCEMVNQYRNHPSVFMWGVRINESLDDDAFYERTNAAAHSYDKTRPTAGVRYLKNSNLLEDVYTFNDFFHSGNNKGCQHKKDVTKTKKGYMITEYNGHMFPTKSFDDETHRTEHAIRHANVLDTVNEYEEIAGSSGWCAFDYNTHKDFGSGDRICYHGVMDMFRNPKTAAYVYSAQAEPEITGDVLEVSSSMDIGEFPAGIRGRVFILTNADSVKMYANDKFIYEYTNENSSYKYLKHGPIIVDDYIGDCLETEDGFDSKTASKLKKVFTAVQRYGIDNIPLKEKLIAATFIASGKFDMGKLWSLGGKYVCNWGKGSVVYKFEAIRDGKVVKTVTKGACHKLNIEASTKRTELIEKETYDASYIRICARDEYGNIQHYYQEAVTLSVKGPLEIIGPSAVSLKGGQAGTYVKTTGKSGKAVLSITDCEGNVQQIEFTVRKEKVSSL